MGSICSAPDEDSQIGGSEKTTSQNEAPLVLWGDVVCSEARVAMTLLALAKVRFDFQHVDTPQIE